MTNAQLYLALGVPIIVNAVINMILFMSLNHRIDDLRNTLGQRINDLREDLNKRFELFEQVVDARLKHLEERKAS